ncbi:helix-turn-helix transcriptional regulator [Streptomyces sp. SPB162]|uniref:helix-turn-helix domain-containing protein n=1 Tax=Streptomyces sp. SPB162 TaxID=2940560 RepID=UPI002405DABD|nr:helix-turn-helix transcriptional regulator [Streptomyces sp. SPB162]MDF9813162.1 transcriptional regulator with XRE-family HTH domain [Streptomyces sp. SPB162]
MGQSAGSSGTARYFAELLRSFRKSRGLTQAQLGELVHVSDSYVSAIETCERIPSPEFIAAADETLEAGGLLALATQHLANDRYPAFFKDFAKLEADALSVSSYSTHMLNGLLQTEDYARAVISSRFPPLEDEEVERLVEARLARRTLFTRKPVALFSFVIETAVLQRQYGSREVMHELLDHLLRCAALRNVVVQVIPSDRGEHAGVDGTVKLIETPEHKHLAYLEMQERSLLIADPDEVARYSQRYAMIRTQALGIEESAALIKQLAGEL